MDESITKEVKRLEFNPGIEGKVAIISAVNGEGKPVKQVQTELVKIMKITGVELEYLPLGKTMTGSLYMEDYFMKDSPCIYNKDAVYFKMEIIDDLISKL